MNWIIIRPEEDLYKWVHLRFKTIGALELYQSEKGDIWIHLIKVKKNKK
jgi:hypothetical protein